MVHFWEHKGKKFHYKIFEVDWAPRPGAPGSHIYSLIVLLMQNEKRIHWYLLETFKIENQISKFYFFLWDCSCLKILFIFYWLIWLLLKCNIWAQNSLECSGRYSFISKPLIEISYVKTHDNAMEWNKKILCTVKSLQKSFILLWQTFFYILCWKRGCNV